MRERLVRHRRAILLTCASLVALASLGVLSSLGGDGSLYVAANAPQRGGDLIVLVGRDAGVGDSCAGTAEVEIELDGIILYPGVYTTVPLRNCQGTVAVPYAKFVVENAQYVVRARMDGQVAETRVFIEKFVNWVYVRSFPDDENRRVRVDVALDSIKGQPLTSGVFANGTLVLDIRWEACSNEGPLGLPIVNPLEPCQADGDLVFHAEVPVDDQASTHIFIPYSALESPKFDDGGAEPGWYNVTATFHNDAAKGNYNVPMDPQVYQEDPPGNWFEVSRE